MGDQACSVCGWGKVIAKARCRTCYLYHRRHGRDRPPSLRAKQVQRMVDREAERRTWGRFAPLLHG